MATPGAGLALFLSTHLDDAVFSCGGTLSVLQRRGWDTIVATVCTEAVENWQGELAHHFNLAGAATVEAGLARRRQEDRRAAQVLGFLPWHLGLCDASFRNHYMRLPASASVFADSTIAYVDPYQVVVTETVRGCIDRLRPGLVFAPAAVGGHVDHLLVRNACIEYAKEGEAAVVWYQDLPYALANLEVSDVGLPREARLGTSVFDEADLQRKCEAAASYTSQLHYFPSNDWRRDLERQAHCWGADSPGERVWRSEMTGC